MGVVTQADGETSNRIYRAYSKHGLLVGVTSSLVVATHWKDTEYVIDQHNVKAWERPSQQEQQAIVHAPVQRPDGQGVVPGTVQEEKES